MKLLLTCCFFLGTLGNLALAQNNSQLPKSIVVTSKPLSMLVNAITGDSFPPVFDGSQSFHHYQVKPSQLLLLTNADWVLWNGDCLEPQLAKIIKKLQAVDLGNCQQEHLHWWLNLQSIDLVSAQVVAFFAQEYPQQRLYYQQNRRQLIDQLTQFAGLFQHHSNTNTATGEKPQLMFYHDRFPEITSYFGLPKALVLQPHNKEFPSIKRKQLLLNQLKNEVDCLVIEPQFQFSKNSQWAKSIAVKNVVFDPLGSTFDNQPDAFIKFYQSILQLLSECQL